LVLIVDDDTTILGLIVMELEERYRVLLASDYHEAHSLLREHPDIAAIVTDWDLGEGLDGWDLLESTGEHWPRIVRILTSGRPGIGDVDPRRGSSKFDAFVSKPWSYGTLTAHLRHLLRAGGHN
jgi:DNA-binding response OmpR family regulator